MNKLLFGLILILSYLPLRLLYLFSDFFYLLLLTVFPYRKKVIDNSVLLISGHYGNWEWMITSLAFLLPFKAIGIGMPLTNSFWDKSVNKRRSRFGLQVVHSKNYKEALYDGETPKAILTLSDQSPGSSENAYWTTFLNQPTAVLFGSEFMAHEYQFTPVFFSIRKVKRGYYSLKLIPFEKPLIDLNYGELTEWHTRLLEQEIEQNPSYWLWSHKRWKRQVPSDLAKLKEDQEKRFEERFRTEK